MEGGEHGGEHVGADRVLRADRDEAARLARELAESRDSGVDRRERVLRLREETRARPGEHDSPRTAHDEPSVELTFELLHAPRQRRLRRAEPLGRRREAFSRARVTKARS